MSTITAPQSTLKTNRRRVWKWIASGVGVLVLVLLVAYGFMFWRMNYIPANLDVSTIRTSAQGRFMATIRPAIEPIPINTMHRWTLHVETPDRRPVTNAAIAVEGDMPQHGHGLPTRPQVTQHLGNGDYLVEGMKFQMGGWRVVDVIIDAAGQRDTVRFNLNLK